MTYRKFTIFFMCVGGAVATFAGVFVLIAMAFDQAAFGADRAEALRVISLSTPVSAIVTVVAAFLCRRMR